MVLQKEKISVERHLKSTNKNLENEKGSFINSTKDFTSSSELFFWFTGGKEKNDTLPVRLLDTWQLIPFLLVQLWRHGQRNVSFSTDQSNVNMKAGK